MLAELFRSLLWFFLSGCLARSILSVLVFLHQIVGCGWRLCLLDDVLIGLLLSLWCSPPFFSYVLTSKVLLLFCYGSSGFLFILKFSREEKDTSEHICLD